MRKPATPTDPKPKRFQNFCYPLQVRRFIYWRFERVWSAFDIIHSKRRNRLKNDRVDKMVFIYAYSKFIKNSINAMVEEGNVYDDMSNNDKRSDDDYFCSKLDEKNDESVISSSCVI